MKATNLLEFNRVGRQIPFDHQSHFKHNGIFEFAQIQARDFLDLFQPVHQRIPMHKQFPGRFRNVQVIFKEALNRKQGFVVQRFDRTALEHFFQEHFAQGRGAADKSDAQYQGYHS